MNRFSREFLGRRFISADILVDQLSERRNQAAHHDGPACTEKIPKMAGRRESGLQGTRLEGILAGVRAMFPESIPGERHGIGSVRGSHEESARIK